jgi:hypothetical protein
MNRWNQLQAILDSIFGHGIKQSSRIAKRIQGFDNQTGEHTVIIEDRVKMTNEDGNDSGFPVLVQMVGTCTHWRGSWWVILAASAFCPY